MIKCLFALVLLIGTITSSQATYLTKTTTTTTALQPGWKLGVDEHVAKFKAALKFYAGPTYKTAKTILDAYLCLISKLETLTESRSTIVWFKSLEILDTISLMKEVGNSPNDILKGLERVIRIVSYNYKNIVSDLETIIGVESDVTKAITDLEVALIQIIADWKNAAPHHIGDDSIDYKPVLKSIQKLTNAVACASEAALKNCESDANVRDYIYILALIFDHMVIIGQITNVSIAADLNVRCGGISNSWTQCLKVIDNLLCGITKALKAVVNTVLQTVTFIVKAIIDLAKSLNEVLKTLFGLVENVTQTLTKTVSKTLTGVTGGLLNVLKIGK